MKRAHKDRTDVTGQALVPSAYPTTRVKAAAQWVRNSATRFMNERATAADLDEAVSEWIAARREQVNAS